MNNFDQVLKNLQTIENLEAQVLKLKEENSTLLEGVKKERGASFKHGEKYYSIRNRSSNNYVTSSDVPWGSWGKKDKAE